MGEAWISSSARCLASAEEFKDGSYDARNGGIWKRLRAVDLAPKIRLFLGGWRHPRCLRLIICGGGILGEGGCAICYNSLETERYTFVQCELVQGVRCRFREGVRVILNELEGQVAVVALWPTW